MHLADFCEVYAQNRLGISDGYVEQLRTAIRTLDRWAGRPVDTANLSAGLLTSFLVAYARQVSPATVNSKRCSLLTLWEAAASSGLCQAVERRSVPKAAEHKRIPEAWTVDQIERLVSECRGLRGYLGGIPRRRWWPSLVLAVWDTGARISALLSSRIVDLDLADRRLLIRAEAQKSRADQLFWLSDSTVASIAGHYSTARELVWPWPCCRRTLWESFRRIVEAAGLTSSRRGMDLFHKLRRSNLSYTAMVDPELARQQPGHTSVQTTQRHYIDPRIARQRSAVDVLPKLHIAEERQRMLPGF
jgi:integrase